MQTGLEKIHNFFSFEQNVWWPIIATTSVRAGFHCQTGFFDLLGFGGAGGWSVYHPI